MQLEGTCKGKLVIVGCSRGVWGELEGIWPIEGHVMCINDMICYYPGFIHHAWTNNQGRLDGYWANRRRAYKARHSNNAGEYRKPLFHTLEKWDEHIGWPFPGNGTSSLNACKAGVLLGYDEVLLCGCPMDDSGHFWEAPWEKMPKGREFARQFEGSRDAWATADREIFKGRVRSISGNTKAFLDDSNDI